MAVAAPQWLASVIDDSWTGVYGARIDGWHLPESRTGRDELMIRYGVDGYHLLDAVHGPGAPGWLVEIGAVQALRLVWIQQFYRDLDGARQEAGTHPRGDGVPPGRDRIVSPYDLDARYSVKRDTGWLGYKVHFTETCDPSEASTDTSDTTATGAGRGEHPNLITNVVTTTATVTDTAMTTTIHQQLADKGLTPTEHLVDSGYPWCPDPKPPAQLLDRPAPRPHPNHTPRPSRLHPRRLNTEPHHGMGHQGPPAAEDPGKVVT